MRRAHAWSGLGWLAVFIATGAYMRWVHDPPVAELNEVTRALYRSRHIYLMLAALANLALAGAHHSDRVISSLVLIAPFFLFVGFVVEPERGLDGAWPIASLGLYMLFGAAGFLVLRMLRGR